jgi:TPR repeat protein
MGKNNLGYCYEHGEGILRDYDIAFKWYTQSANDGCNLGKYNLGRCYHYGIGTKINIEAIIWYKKASDNGVGNANIELNKMSSNK